MFKSFLWLLQKLLDNLISQSQSPLPWEWVKMAFSFDFKSSQCLHIFKKLMNLFFKIWSDLFDLQNRPIKENIHHCVLYFEIGDKIQNFSERFHQILNFWSTLQIFLIFTLLSFISSASSMILFYHTVEHDIELRRLFQFMIFIFIHIILSLMKLILHSSIFVTLTFCHLPTCNDSLKFLNI